MVERFRPWRGDDRSRECRVLWQVQEVHSATPWCVPCVLQKASQERSSKVTDRRQKAAIIRTQVPWRKWESMNTLMLADLGIDPDALAAEQTALFRDIMIGQGLDHEDDSAIFLAPLQVDGVQMEFGAEDGFSICPRQMQPCQLKGFSDRTIKFFRLAKQVGLLQPAIKLWLFLGTPQACRRSKKWRRLSSWLTRQITLKNRIALAANV